MHNEEGHHYVIWNYTLLIWKGRKKPCTMQFHKKHKTITHTQKTTCFERLSQRTAPFMIAFLSQVF